MKIDLRHLVLVKTIVEEGSVTRAADKLYLSQSALSHQLRDLEEKLESQVFVRMNKKLLLTEAGEKILNSAKTVLCEMRCLENKIENLKKGQKGRVRISTECYTSYHWLPRFMQSFQKEYPDIDLTINAEATKNPMDYLRDGSLDVGIFIVCDKKPYEEELDYYPLFTDELVAILPKSHVLSGAKKIKPEDFLNERVLIYDIPFEESTFLQNMMSPLGYDVSKAMRIPLTEAIIEMVKAGIGVSVLAKWAIHPYLKSKKLVSLPLDHPAVQRTWYAVKLKDNNNPVIGNFIKYIEENPFNIE